MEFRTLASSLAGLVDSRPLGPPPVAPSLPNEDVDEPGKQSLGFAEGQSFAIEYVDAAGRPSSRRITVYDIQMTSSGVPCLYARCHERGAMRSFRVDRIKYCIDYDGEVFDDVPAFLHE